MRPPEAALSMEDVMKRKTIPALISGFAITLLASIALWQLLVVALLVRSMADVLGVFGRLF
jgi:hypothetical protein